ncbi:MAG: hypothetical protein RL449_1100 [Bacteroidota bacterium]|jgi:hypothetical protein
MKNSIRLLTFLLTGFNSFSQETLIKINKDTSSQMKTLFKPARLQSFGLSFQSQMLFGKGGPERGMGLQVHLNNKLSLGIASFNSMPDRDGSMQMGSRQRFSAFTMEATPMANKVFHLSFPLAIGRIQEDAPMMYNIYNYTSSMMPQPGPGRGMNRNDRRGPGTLGVQPGINLEVNLFKYVKVFGGANYRFAFGEEKTPGMSRAAGTLGVKVGVFDYRKKR